MFHTKRGHYEFLIVLFGLTNELVAFIDSVNRMSNGYLGGRVTVFIGNIFVFTKARMSDDYLGGRITVFIGDIFVFS